MAEKTIIRVTSHYLEAYLNCPLYFDITVNKKRGPSSKPANMARGIAMHELLATYYRSQGLEGLSFDQAVEKAVTDFQISSLDINGFLLDDTDMVLTTFHEYTQHYRSRDENLKILAVEEKLSRVLYEDDRYVMLWEGTKDLLVERTDGDILPYDHKTEKSKWNISQLNNQFLGYCFLANSNRMVRNAIGFQTSKPPSEKFYRTMYSFSHSAIAWWRETTISKIKEILVHYEKNDWDVSANLNMCDLMYRKGCDFKAVHTEDRSDWAAILERDYVHVEPYS